MAPADSKPLQVLVTPLIHCPDLEEPPAPFAPLKDVSGPSARSRVCRRAGAATSLTGAASLGPQTVARDGCSPTEGFPSPLIAQFLIFVLVINLYNYIMSFVCNKGSVYFVQKFPLMLLNYTSWYFTSIPSVAQARTEGTWATCPPHRQPTTDRRAHALPAVPAAPAFLFVPAAFPPLGRACAWRLGGASCLCRRYKSDSSFSQ
ncbi:hypothetical protein VULLAG_LOCUS4180 [Vulpes lagopus]